MRGACLKVAYLLCGRLLRAAEARVEKIEDVRRLGPARECLLDLPRTCAPPHDRWSGGAGAKRGSGASAHLPPLDRVEARVAPCAAPPPGISAVAVAAGALDTARLAAVVERPLRGGGGGGWGEGGGEVTGGGGGGMSAAAVARRTCADTGAPSCRAGRRGARARGSEVCGERWEALGEGVWEARAQVGGTLCPLLLPFSTVLGDGVEAQPVLRQPLNAKALHRTLVPPTQALPVPPPRARGGLRREGKGNLGAQERGAV